MAWIAALIGAGAGLYGNSRSRAAQQSAQDEARKALEASQGSTAGLQPYGDIGRTSLYSLAELMALPGYRTPSERALRELKAPDRGAYTPGSVGQGEYSKLMDKLFSLSDKSGLSSILGRTGSSTLSAPAAIIGPGPAAALTRHFGRKGRQEDEARAGEQARLEAEAQARYEADVVSYNKDKAELEAKRDEELSRFDPTARLKQTPGYQFRYQTGLNQVSNTQAARNRSLGGRAIKELSDYGQGAASQEYGQEYNRLSNLAGLGQTASTNLAQFGINQGTSLATLAQGQGSIDANYYNNMNNVLQGSIGNYLTYQNQRKKPAQTPYDSSFGSTDPNSAAGSKAGQDWWNE